MVRLKAHVLPITLYISEKFQFHYGAIKSDKIIDQLLNERHFNSTMVRLKGRVISSKNCSISFQFHYGAIKRSLTVGKSKKVYLFQFHYGAIKSRIHALSETFSNEFQFHYGAIKS